MYNTFCVGAFDSLLLHLIGGKRGNGHPQLDLTRDAVYHEGNIGKGFRQENRLPNRKESGRDGKEKGASLPGGR